MRLAYKRQDYVILNERNGIAGFCNGLQGSFSARKEFLPERWMTCWPSLTVIFSGLYIATLTAVACYTGKGKYRSLP
jgi:hypothetical protein